MIRNNGTILYLISSIVGNFSFVSLTPIIENSYAHRDGCHRWHSCPSDSGSYACGDLGYNKECRND